MNKIISRPKNHGFTLIEIMIAIMIMAALTVFTAQAIKSGLVNRERYQKQMARDSLVRDALHVIARDINLAYHFRDLDYELKKANQSGKNKNDPAADQLTATPTPGPTPDRYNQDPNVLRPSFDYSSFIGDSESLSFTSASHVRTVRDSQESDLAKIGYRINTCKSFRNKKGSSKCLWRRVDPVLDDDVTKGGTETVLIENVEKFKLRYVGVQKTEKIEYLEQWKTGQNGTPETRDKFPLAVEVELTMHNKNDPNEKPVTMSMLAPLRFPNNVTKKENKSGDAANATPTPKPLRPEQ